MIMDLAAFCSRVFFDLPALPARSLSAMMSHDLMTLAAQEIAAMNGDEGHEESVAGGNGVSLGGVGVAAPIRPMAKSLSAPSPTPAGDDNSRRLREAWPAEPFAGLLLGGGGI